MGPMAQRVLDAVRSWLAGALRPGTPSDSEGEVDEGSTSLIQDVPLGGASSAPGSSFSPASRPFPPLGLRGGLGKSLLIAFLLLAIVPLSLLAVFTYNQIQRDTRQRLILSLEEMVALKGAYLVDWAESRERELSLAAEALEQAEIGEDAARQGPAELLAAVRATDPAFSGLVLVSEGGTIVTSGPGASSLHFDATEWLSLRGQRPRVLGLAFIPTGAGALSPAGDEKLIPAVCYAWDDRLLVGLLEWEALRQVFVTGASQSVGSTKDLKTSLVTEDGVMIGEQGVTFLAVNGGSGAASLAAEDPRPAASLPGEPTLDEEVSEGISQVMAGEHGSGAYTDLAGVPVFGAYRWLPEVGVGILAEQPQLTSLATGDTLTALVVGATLGVALLTAAIAAVVTRRITRPIVQLTQTASWMARGDLNQRVPVTRKDEIGVLARAFNHMASELRLLYANLEAKVAERTQQLEEASQYTRYYLMQLAISAEVARVASSIRDLDVLLNTVAELIDRAFELHRTTIYLLENSDSMLWRAGSACEASALRSGTLQGLPDRVAVDEATLVGQVAADGVRRVVRPGAASGSEGVACEMALPLRVRDKILGVLYLQSTRPDDFGEKDQVVFRSLADQISIAIENARAYALERETVKRLRELDRIQAEFLTNMSHALRTPLNSVIGFSRVMLKELDGPLTELQRVDLTTIYGSGRQLLSLINNMLELSHLDLGVAPFSPSEVDLEEIIEGVMATTQALARSKPIQIYSELPPTLPTLYTDGQRVRQVILALLSNAVKFTEQGSIRLAVSVDAGAPSGQEITISVSDTGSGMSEVERQALFTERSYEDEDSDESRPGPAREQPAGFGLAISKRVVERLGGRIWVQSEEGVGSTFTFTLPIRLDEAAPAGSGRAPAEGYSASAEEYSASAEEYSAVIEEYSAVAET